MDFSFIKKWLGQYTQVAGLAITLLDKEKYQLQLVVLRKEKNNVKLLTRQLHLTNFEQLADHINKNSPLIILLDGKGVIHKKVNDLPEDPTNILQTVLPTASPADFLFSVYSVKTFHWLSIIRRPVVEEILQQLKALSLSPIQVVLGIFPLRYIFPFLPKDTAFLSTGTHNLIVDQGEILHLERNDTTPKYTINVAGESIELPLLPAFAAAFMGLIGLKERIHPEGITTAIEEDFQYQKLFRLVGWTGLISLLILLLVNFATFGWLNKKNQQQDIELAYHRTNLERLATIKEQYQEAQQFFEQNSVLKSSKVSYYANEIGRSLPKGIQLIHLDVFPAKGSNQRERTKSQQFNQQTIKIKGESQRSTLLNEWIKDLEQLEWILEVEVLPYSESDRGLGNFELRLLIE